MANKYTAEYDAAYITTPYSKFPVGDAGGRVRSLYGEFDLAAAVDSGDVIFFGKLPKGARVIGGYIFSDDLGNTITVEVGWNASAAVDSSGTAIEAADTDGFMNAVDLNAAAICTNMIGQTATGRPGIGKKFTAEVDVVVVAEATGTATSGTIRLCILYVVD